MSTNKLFADAAAQGFVRVRVDGEMHQLSEEINLKKQIKHDIEIVVDRIILKEDSQKRLADSLEICLNLADGLALVSADLPDGEHEEKLFSQNFACVDCGISMDELAPRMFSFNSPFWCLSCLHRAGLFTTYR